jgi:hypothetical protein
MNINTSVWLGNKSATERSYNRFTFVDYFALVKQGSRRHDENDTKMKMGKAPIEWRKRFCMKYKTPTNHDILMEDMNRDRI